MGDGIYFTLNFKYKKLCNFEGKKYVISYILYFYIFIFIQSYDFRLPYKTMAHI